MSDNKLGQLYVKVKASRQDCFHNLQHICRLSEIQTLMGMPW